jgi:hypothetical protein
LEEGIASSGNYLFPLGRSNSLARKNFMSSPEEAVVSSVETVYIWRLRRCAKRLYQLGK